jgi:hypothetical protein
VQSRSFSALLMKHGCNARSRKKNLFLARSSSSRFEGKHTVETYRESPSTNTLSNRSSLNDHACMDGRRGMDVWCAPCSSSIL